MTEWFRKYGDDVQKFAAIKSPQESHKFLSENMHLVCDHMASYLVIYCVDLEVEEVWRRPRCLCAGTELPAAASLLSLAASALVNHRKRRRSRSLRASP